MEEPSYLEKPMFGCLAIYLHGRLMLVLASGEEPWDGLLIPTEHQFHQAIVKEFQDVVQHSVLKKWLYLPEATEDFETVALILLRQSGEEIRGSGSNLKNGSGRKGIGYGALSSL